MQGVRAILCSSARKRIGCFAGTGGDAVMAVIEEVLMLLSQ